MKIDFKFRQSRPRSRTYYWGHDMSLDNYISGVLEFGRESAQRSAWFSARRPSYIPAKPFAESRLEAYFQQGAFENLRITYCPKGQLQI